MRSQLSVLQNRDRELNFGLDGGIRLFGHPWRNTRMCLGDVCILPQSQNHRSRNLPAAQTIKPVFTRIF
jgi:hypothetical protein